MGFSRKILIIYSQRVNGEDGESENMSVAEHERKNLINRANEYGGDGFSADGVFAEHNWKLSPAYDLSPSPVIAQERRDLAMDCGDMGRYANAKNILSQHARFLLERSEAEKITNDMRDQVASTWYNTVRACGVTEKDADTIRGAFVYP